MRILTYNINSVRLRLPLLEEICQTLCPDIVCLQETKVQDHLFPRQPIEDMGYRYMLCKGMKSYNGVAILSKIPFHPLKDMPKWCEKEDCRHVAARFEQASQHFDLHNFYIPAGGDEPDVENNPKFAHKLAFLTEMRAWFQKNTVHHTILTGDFNIAPLPEDVWSHKQLLKTISHTPVEVAHLQALQQTGFTDLARYQQPQGKLFSWWSYRNRDWKKSNRGRRLDHIWASHDLLPKFKNLTIHTMLRDSPKPSDHVPITADFSF